MRRAREITRFFYSEPGSPDRRMISRICPGPDPRGDRIREVRICSAENGFSMR